jgi:hypothetical protein
MITRIAIAAFLECADFSTSRIGIILPQMIAKTIFFNSLVSYTLS